MRHSAMNWGKRYVRTRAFFVALVAAILFVVTFAFAVSQQLYSQVSTIELRTESTSPEKRDTISIPADFKEGEPVTIAVMGTDDRTGDNADIGGFAEGIRADTTVLLHITADRSQVRMASIPRDLMTEIPGCLPGENPDVAVSFQMFNTAFARGYDYQENVGDAVQCVLNTIARSTGIKPDAAAVLDFKAVVDIVNELDGVKLCGETHFEPRDAGGLILEPGCERIYGDEAIQFLRARHVGNDGSDLKRIERQQCFLRSASAEVLRGGLLEQASNIFSIAKVLTAHTKLTPNLASVSNLSGLIYSLRNLTPADVVTRTAPVAPWPADPNRVIWAWDAPQFWEDFVAPPVKETPAPSPSSSESNAPNDTESSEPVAPSDQTPSEPSEPPSDEISADDEDALICY